MRVLCFCGFVLLGAFGEISDGIAHSDGVQACHEEVPLGDATSLLQRSNLQVIERGQDEISAVTLMESGATTRRCLHDHVDSMDCAFTNWSEWTDCSKPCGSGIRTRSRDIKFAAPGTDSGTCGCLKEAETCNVKPCTTIDCTFSTWSDWTECTKSCGSGLRSRTRKVTKAAEKDGTCGCTREADVCSVDPCEPNPTISPESTVCGHVKHARTDAAVANVEVSIKGGNLSPVSTGPSGEFCFKLPPGEVTLTAAKDKFITKEVKRTISVGDIDTIFINPQGSAGEWRIVLEWGKKPIDLDAHTLVQGLCPPGGRQDVYHQQRSCVKDGVNATLDLDHCFKKGGTCSHKHDEPTPETTTITNVDANSLIYFCVHNWSAKQNLDDPPVAIENSEAVVRVSHGKEEVAMYEIKDIDDGESGYVQGGDWHAFFIKRGNVYACRNGNCPC